LIQILYVASTAAAALSLLEVVPIPSVRAFIILTNRKTTTTIRAVERTTDDVSVMDVASTESIEIENSVSSQTTTTIQVCGSKDCTRRGGGARLEKQIRQVLHCNTFIYTLCNSIFKFYVKIILTRYVILIIFFLLY
jgi:hypothetical protein